MHLRGKLEALDDNIVLYSPRSRLSGSVICHFGEIHTSSINLDKKNKSNMLDTNKFIDQLIIQKYTHLCVVPCSLVAKNLINASVNMQKKLEYLPCASEGSFSKVAGLKMAGKKPIVIVQSSGSYKYG